MTQLSNQLWLCGVAACFSGSGNVGSEKHHCCKCTHLPTNATTSLNSFNIALLNTLGLPLQRWPRSCLAWAKVGGSSQSWSPQIARFGTKVIVFDALLKMLLVLSGM